MHDNTILNNVSILPARLSAAGKEVVIVSCSLKYIIKKKNCLCNLTVHKKANPKHPHIILSDLGEEGHRGSENSELRNFIKLIDPSAPPMIHMYMVTLLDLTHFTL
jgi:hypothetical protein